MKSAMTNTPFIEGEPGADLVSNIRYLGKQRKLLGKRTDASWILFPVFTSTSRLHSSRSPASRQFVHRRRARALEIVRTMGSRRCANETAAANRSHNAGPGPFHPKTPVVRTIWRSGIVRTMDPMVVRTISQAGFVRTTRALQARGNSGAESGRVFPKSGGRCQFGIDPCLSLLRPSLRPAQTCARAWAAQISPTPSRLGFWPGQTRVSPARTDRVLIPHGNRSSPAMRTSASSLCKIGARRTLAPGKAHENPGRVPAHPRRRSQPHGADHEPVQGEGSDEKSGSGQHPFLQAGHGLRLQILQSRIRGLSPPGRSRLGGLLGPSCSR